MANDNYPIIIKNDSAPRSFSQGGKPNLSERLRLLARNPITWVVGVTIVIAVILLIISLRNIHSQPTMGDTCGRGIVIDNINEYASDMPSEAKDYLFCILYGRVADELGMEEGIPESGARFRDGTVEKHDDSADGVYYGTAMVDIDELHQSWHLVFEWPSKDSWIDGESSYEAMPTCPSAEENLYDDFSCNMLNDTWSFTDGPLTLDDDPYYGTLENGTTYAARLRYYVESNEPYIEVSVDSCGNADIISATQASVEEWLGSTHDVESDTLPPIHIRDLCDGED